MSKGKSRSLEFVSGGERDASSSKSLFKSGMNVTEGFRVQQQLDPRLLHRSVY